MEKNEVEARILAILDQLRPFLISDGGNLDFVKFEDGIVYVKLTGACAGCEFANITLKDGIEQMLINEIEEVKEVRNITENA